MGDLFDEVMNMLDDAGGATSGGHHWQPNTSHGHVIQAPHTNSWGLSPSTFAPDPAQGYSVCPGLSMPSMPVDTYSQCRAVGQNIRYSEGTLSQGQRIHLTWPTGGINLSQFECDPHTPKHSIQSINSSPSGSSPTSYNLRYPYRLPVGRQKMSTVEQVADHKPSQPEKTQHNPKKWATTLERVSLSHALPVIRGIRLIPVDTIPNRFWEIFPFPLFNAVQSRCFHSVYKTSDNIVLSSPTGSGKTAVMELAICALANELGQGNYKVIYQAPTKALCAERKRDWEGKFATLGLVCTELTGDTQQAQLRGVKNGDIIITTPEKWDSMTRRWGDHKKLLELVRLFLIDEVHILKEARGATLEVVVSRMKSIGSNVRFVALSATVPNLTDIAIWLGKNSADPHLPASEERFGEEFRPVKLQKFVYGYPSTGNGFMFDKTLDKALPDIIQKHSAGKPIMIFCMTRAICASTAKMLAERWKMLQQREGYWPAPTIEFSFKDRDLQSTGTCGVAFHHAGLDAGDRSLVERLFLEGSLYVICCTSTLAIGVNLPVYLVIIKNTVTWADGQTKDYVDLEVMQMLGRAGRPQFDDTAVAVIMTKREGRVRYEKMVSGTEVLESCLHGNLVEHMNAEIGLGTITNLESAKGWLRSTFLYVRLKSNPEHYKLGQYGGPGDVDRILEKICEKNIDLLSQYGLVFNKGAGLKCSELGDAMARYYIRFTTMQTILELEEKAKVPEVLLTLSKAEEFKDIRFRSGEKGLYKELNRSVKYPLKTELANTSHKAYILIQFEVGMMEFPAEGNLQKYKTTLMQDKNLVFQHCHRVIRCIIDCKLHFKDSVSVRNSLEVARCLKARVWENSPLQLRQMEGFGPASVKKLINAGIRSLEMLEKLEPHKIESIMSRNPPFGSKVAKAVRDIPKLRVFSHQVSKVGNHKDPVNLKVRAEIGYLNTKPPERFRGMVLFANFLAERSDGLLIDFRRIPIFKLEGGKSIQLTVDLENPEQTIICHLVCEDIVGTLKTHELKPDVDFVLYPPRASLLPLSPATPQVPAGGKFDTTRVLRECLPIVSPGENMGGISLLPHMEQQKRRGDLAGGVGKDLYFLHIDDFDMSDIDEDFTQQTKVNTGVDTTHTNARISPALFAPDGNGAPEKLPNGNYMCRHKCGDKTKCKHFCCREGLGGVPKDLKRKTSMSIDQEPVQGGVPTKVLILSPRQEQLTGSFNMQEYPRHRVPALVTDSINVDIEVLDLVGGEGSAYHQKHKTSHPNRRKTHHPKSAVIHYRPLAGKQAYLNKEVPGPSFVKFGRTQPSHNGEPPSPQGISTYDLEGNHLPLGVSTDCGEIRIASPTANIMMDEPLVSVRQADNSGPGVALPSTTPERILGLMERQDRDLFSPRNFFPLVDESPINGCQAPRFVCPNQNCKSSNSAKQYEEVIPDNAPPVFYCPSCHKALPYESYDDRTTLCRGLTWGSPGVMSSRDSVPDKMRKDLFSTHQKAKRSRALMDLDTGNGDGAASLNLGSPNCEGRTRTKAKAVGGSNQITPAPVQSGEFPVDILSFLGECVTYSG